jgi:AcrR family transcriptional regulator
VDTAGGRSQESAPAGSAGTVARRDSDGVERALRAARARAQTRSLRFVAATLDLMHARGSMDFTVQDVVAESRMSIRTFYNFFASKDDLLVAVHATILADVLTPRLRQRVEAESDPVLRIRSYIECMFDMSTHAGPIPRALTTYRHRLAEARPQELARAFHPLLEYVRELVRAADRAGELRSGLTADRAAYLLHHTVIAAVHGSVLDATGETSLRADELWTFCASGLGFPSRQVLRLPIS